MIHEALTSGEGDGRGAICAETHGWSLFFVRR